MKPSVVFFGVAGPLLTYLAWFFTASPLVSPISLIAKTIVFLALCCCVLAILTDILRCLMTRDVVGLLAWLLVQVTLAIITVHAMSVPLAAWDALGGEWGVHSYAEQAVRIINSEFGGETPRSPRHPPLIPYILMEGVVVSELANLKISAGALGSLLALALPLSPVCALGVTLNNVSLSPFLCLAFLALPLLENHVGVFGYSEVFVWSLSQVLFLTLFLMLISSAGDSFPALMFALLVTGILLFTKSLAVIFITAGWSAYFFSAASFRMLINFSIASLIIAAFVTIGLGEHGVGYLLPTASGDGSAINANFSGRFSQIDVANVLPSLKAMGLALFVNGSFSVLPLASLIIYGCCIDLKSNSRPTKYLAILLVLIFLAFVLLGSTNYIADNGSWGQDTLLSRSMLPYLAVFPLILLHAAVSLQVNSKGFRVIIGNISKLRAN